MQVIRVKDDLPGKFGRAPHQVLEPAAGHLHGLRRRNQGQPVGLEHSAVFEKETVSALCHGRQMLS